MAKQDHMSSEYTEARRKLRGVERVIWRGIEWRLLSVRDEFAILQSLASTASMSVSHAAPLLEVSPAKGEPRPDAGYFEVRDANEDGLRVTASRMGDVCVYTQATWVYLSPAEARGVATSLLRAADLIEARDTSDDPDV